MLASRSFYTHSINGPCNLNFYFKDEYRTSNRAFYVTTLNFRILEFNHQT